MAQRAMAIVPSMSSIKAPLDANGDGVINRSDFVPRFLDRDGDGHISVLDMSHDVKIKAKKVGNAYMRDKVEQMFVDMYLQRLKPGLTACAHAHSRLHPHAVKPTIPTPAQ